MMDESTYPFRSNENKKAILGATSSSMGVCASVVLMWVCAFVLSGPSFAPNLLR